MILENHHQAAAIRADFCVIGAGAMGMALALKLVAAGKSVLLLEAGGEDITEVSQDHLRCEIRGRGHVGSSGGRFRVFGGSTERWGGQAMRFDRADTAARPGIHEGGWSLDYDGLAAWYSEAERFMGVENAPYDQFRHDFNRAVAPDAALAEFADFKIHYSVFTREPRLRETYRAELTGSPTLHLWRGAAVTKLHTEGHGRVTGATVRAGGETGEITADQFILATGGIENARFLLIQRDVQGVAELASLDAIGRFFQDHPGAHVAEIHGKGSSRMQGLFRLKHTPAMSLKGRISWAEEKRLAAGLPAVSGTFLAMRKRSEYDTEGPARRIGSPAEWLEVAKSGLRGEIYSPLHHTYLAVSAEDIRDPQSRITLSETLQDATGTPRAKIEWKVDPRVATSIIEYVDAVDDALKRLSFPPLRKFPCLASPDELTAALRDNSHHIGATSMGTSPRDAVVDRDLRVFGFSNFWIAGTSVLPTGSHANPTLTALALAFRLADHLTRSA
jgi:choline dehydrogenase-like flavoprotein